MPWVPFKCWSSEGVSLIKSVCGFFKRNCLGLQNFLLLTQSLLIFADRSYEDFSWHWNPGLGAWCAAGSACSSDIPPEFFFTTQGWETCPFSICAPPTSLDGCGFFNSIVVRLPFNSISDSSEWWLFYIWVVILIWLGEEVSHICLCFYLDWKLLVYSQWKFEPVKGNAR